MKHDADKSFLKLHSMINQRLTNLHLKGADETVTMAMTIADECSAKVYRRDFLMD